MKIKKIHIIAPSGPLPEEARAEVIETFTKLAAERDIDVEYSELILTEPAVGFYALKIEDRVRSFLEALVDEESQVIWALRGGYGAAELLISCEVQEAIKGTRKILIGFSDITALHAAFNLNDKASVHGPVVNSLLKSPLPQKKLSEVLDLIETKPKSSYKLEAYNDCAKEQTESLNGEVNGGNLTVFTSLVGTDHLPDTTGKFLIFEDVGEAGYKVMRMFNQLCQTSLLAKADAVLIGAFTDSDRSLDFALEEMVRRFLPETPVYKIENIGHIPENTPIILGSKAEISLVDGVPYLTVTNPFYEDAEVLSAAGASALGTDSD